MDASVVVCGQIFQHEVLERINAAVRDQPQWSRAELARRVCEWLDWSAEGGRRKVRLRDRRHLKRLFTVARDFYAQPGANIPQACQSRAKTKAAYRVELHSPKRKPSLGVLSLWTVYVTEVNPPSQKEAVEWMLLTTLEVNSFEQVLEKIDWYNRRWGIEEYHRTLKSGCRIENRQLGDRTVWENCLAIDLVVAWRIEHIRKLSRTLPEAPCSVAFEEHEWQALLAFKRPDQPLPSTPPNVREITRLTAELGGFLGRKGDGEPGSTTLGRGLQRLHDIASAFLIFKQHHSIQQPTVPKPPVISHRDYGQRSARRGGGNLS